MKRTKGAESELYRAYLVRLWRSDPGEAWRVSVEDIRDRRCHGFPNLAAAFTFLHRESPQLVQGEEGEAYIEPESDAL